MTETDRIAAATQHLREGRAEAALPLLEALLDAAPERVDALHLLGIAHGQLGRFDAALPLLERAAALRPDEAAIHNNFGNTLAGVERDADAVAAFDRALALQPRHAMAWRNRGAALRRLGRLTDALDSFERALAIDAGFVDALIGKADALEAMLRRREAIETLHAALDAGADPDSVGYTLATLGAGTQPDATPPEFVRKLFDDYAGRFDKHLVDRLEYRVPEMIAQALQDAGVPAGLDVVDLGCGTGLCGPLLRARAGRLVGVDLSAGMLTKARLRGVYDDLVDGEIVEWLGARRAAFDLAVAADVLIYLGDLGRLFGPMAGALRPRGWFAFSVEDWVDGDFGLKASGRYGHAARYLRAVAAEHGFEVLSLTQQVLRRESTQAIDGHVVVLQRNGGT